jgi:transcriptional regulator with XRE-family HTH domain
MNADQCRMARAALKWSTAKLAQKAGVGLNTVNRFEAGADAQMSSVKKMQAALEAGGVEFTNGNQLGVRLKATEPCQTCLGTGNDPTMRTPKRGAKIAFQPCPDCGGTGRKPLSIPIEKLNASND